MELEVIARIKSPMKEKFGLPRQSGLCGSLEGEIIFEEKYADNNAVDGLEGFDYIWLLWEFEGVGREFRPKVRPPRLGGNTYMGVFATRSPFRPNPIGLSCVRLLEIEKTDKGPVLHVSGADLRDGTPIYDIKPYLPYADSHQDARGGFAQEKMAHRLDVRIDTDVPGKLNSDDIETIKELLSQDPRPAYQDDSERIYGMCYKEFDVKFRVCESIAIVTEIVLR